MNQQNNRIMKAIANLLRTDLGTGTTNSPEFNNFAKKFNLALRKELLKINATKVVICKGHFYISGFFTVGEQAYYFSLSDVRGGRTTNMLVRTAKSYSDYTGGPNNWVDIDADMAKNIARLFRLPFTPTTPTTRPKVDLLELAKRTVAAGQDVTISMPSAKKAHTFLFGMMAQYSQDALGGGQYVTTSKWGRSISRVFVDHIAPFKAIYRSSTKKMKIEFLS